MLEEPWLGQGNSVQFESKVPCRQATDKGLGCHVGEAGRLV